MSTIKNPKEKKRLSLARDRRNVWREDTGGTRRGIPRGKRRQHKQERHDAAQILGHLDGQVDEDRASQAELDVKVATAVSRGRGFKKCPDQPLGITLERKMAKRSVKQLKERP